MAYGLKACSCHPLKKKSHEVSARKNNNWLRYNKKCRGGGRIKRFSWPEKNPKEGANCSPSVDEG